MSEFLWMIWGIGLLTGATATYMGCILFSRSILAHQSELMALLVSMSNDSKGGSE